MARIRFLIKLLNIKGRAFCAARDRHIIALAVQQFMLTDFSGHVPKCKKGYNGGGLIG